MDLSATVKQGASCPQPYGEDAHNPSVGAGFAATDWSQKGWRNQLHRLDELDLPLLAVGAGAERKAPANLRDVYRIDADVTGEGRSMTILPKSQI